MKLRRKKSKAITTSEFDSKFKKAMNANKGRVGLGIGGAGGMGFGEALLNKSAVQIVNDLVETAIMHFWELLADGSYLCSVAVDHANLCVNFDSITNQWRGAIEIKGVIASVVYGNYDTAEKAMEATEREYESKKWSLAGGDQIIKIPDHGKGSVGLSMDPVKEF